MWAKERHQRIVSLLAARHQVSANELADMLGVSRETVRRDLLDLEKVGQVNRVHGGAVLPEPISEEPFLERKKEQVRAKSEIARKAASLVQPGFSIMVDAGTTTAIFARELAKLSDVSVITNSLEIATTLQSAGKDVLLLGGTMAPEVPATWGELTLSEIRRFRVDLCFSSPVAVHPTRGVFFHDLQEAEIAIAMANQSGENVLLADHTKLGETSRVQSWSADEISALVTSQAATAAQLEPFRERGVTVVN
ncbi:DeoR/GlpR family DNA-binding transcription regulator [Tepidamorphus sp. 3E244]|uniref:DeoR/GlpR family DNA-binding transcription regulator n=1 Tax=Tepidamorphus sp. 3E244 TaxID=3385498 RepID=UPI0038FC30D0